MKFCRKVFVPREFWQMRAVFRLKFLISRPKRCMRETKACCGSFF